MLIEMLQKTFFNSCIIDMAASDQIKGVKFKKIPTL